ncbi:streptophobe family protein [Streptomyces cavernae]|uniref:streptophobe family protein n=1 Tax=Streptomyces cavernae TaxID=2259034 RepID=UPI0012D99F16|nr:streptophobe family protein [Streptomyces cavernae]
MESDGTAEHGGSVPWGDVLLGAIASVSWALIGMTGVAALGLRLLEADRAGSLGPMTAAVVALGAGGSVTPSGDVSAFGLTGAEASTAIEITPLGVSLVGALLLSWFFLRSLRTAGAVIAPAELAARAGAVLVVFVATLGGLAWAGHDVITFDGSQLGLDDAADSLPGGIGDSLPDGLGDLGGLLPDNIGGLIDAKASVGFTVDTVPTLLGGAAWVLCVLVVALLASRRTPLPRGWEALHRVVRPAVSALVSVLLVAVAAGFAAAAYAAVGDDNPKLVTGAALLGAPNGVWLGIPVGLFVPWDGKATGELLKVLPDPLDDLLRVGTDQTVTLGRLAELDGRVWLLGVASALMMLLAGVLVGVRTPRPEVVAYEGGSAARRGGTLAFAGRCALWLGIVTALGLPLLAYLTDVSVDASLSVLGVDAFGAGMELHGRLAMALLLGAVWGAGAGAAGALLACAAGAAGRRAAPLALGKGLPYGKAPGPRYERSGAVASYGRQAEPYAGSYAPPRSTSRSESPPPPLAPSPQPPPPPPPPRSPSAPSPSPSPSPSPGAGPQAPQDPHAPASGTGGPAGPYHLRAPYRPPREETNPYLRLPDEGLPTAAGPAPPQPGAPSRPPRSRPDRQPPPPPPSPSPEDEPPPPGTRRGRG